MFLELPHTRLQSGGPLALLVEGFGLTAVQQGGMADAEVACHGGGGMAVEEHRHRFLLEFVGVDPALGLGWVFVGFHGSLLGCLVRVNLSSRSVHKSPYTSVFRSNQANT